MAIRRTVSAPLPASKGDLIPHFIEAVLTGVPLEPGTQHEFDVISTCAAAHRATAARQEIEIDYV